MGERQALNATFFAFQKRDKMVLAPATAMLVVLLLIVGGAFVWLSRDAIGDYFSWAMSMAKQNAAAADGKPGYGSLMMAPPASVINLIPLSFAFQVLYYIVVAAWEAACLKWMIRGDASGLFGLSLGADTWRVYFTYWLWFLLLIVIYIACIIIAATVGFGLFGAAAMSGKGETTTTLGPAVMIAFALGLALIGAFIYVAVRFAPAAATSVAERRFAFFDAWKVTRGRFWAMLGAFLLLWLMFIVGYFMVSIAVGLIVGVQLVSAMAANGAGAQTSPQQMWAVLTQPGILVPLLVLYLVVIGAVMTFLVALQGVNARAARLALEEGVIAAPTS